MISRFTFDTNILIYSIDARDETKHRTAKRLIRSFSDSGCLVALQCLSEFFRATTRKQRLSATDAARVINECRLAMHVVPPSEDDLIEAMKIHQQHGVPFFDALLAATIRRVDCTTLFSEDFQHARSFGTLTILNPFQLTEAELDHLFA